MKKEYQKQCGYQDTGLADEIILFGENAVKDIRIDDGEAYIDSISANFLRIACSNVTWEENQTISGRYAFEKTVSFTVNGYYGKEFLDGYRYAILKTNDGAYRLINVDFSAIMSYEFTLDDTTYQTEYTLYTLSNYPSLKVNGDFGALERICAYGTVGIDKILMNLKDSVLLDRANAKLVTNSDRFVDVEYLTASVSETYSDNSNSALTTLNISIPISDYESSWHYSISEFHGNKFAFIISPVSSPQRLFLGFDMGMMPLYTENASEDSSSINITFTERGNLGICAIYDYEEEIRSNITYQNVARVGNIDTTECAGEGIAQYLVQREVDGLGNPTGNYLAYTGYETYFRDLGINITGTFNGYYTFSSNKCLWNTCVIDTDIPPTLNFYGTGSSDTYTMHSNCDWSIENLPAQITSSVSEGTGGSYYSISFTNTSASEYRGKFTITAGGASRDVNVIVGKRIFMYPSAITTDCYQKEIPIVSDSSCSDISALSNYLNIRRLASGYFIVSVPENFTETGRTMSITFVNNCTGRQQIVDIDQDKRYVEWRTTDRYICENGHKYIIEQQYSGSTGANIAETPITRKGEEVTGVTECSVEESSYISNDTYVCVDSVQYEALAEVTGYTGGNMSPTNRYMLGDETDGTYDCSHSLAEMTGDGYYRIVDGETAVNRSIVTLFVDDPTTIYYAQIGDSVTSIGYRAFYQCYNLSDLIIGSGVTLIDEQAFRNCYSLSSVSMPNSLRTLGAAAFSGCTTMTGLTIGANVKTIPERCFEACEKVDYIEMPYNVIEIENYAFNGCSSLTIKMVRPTPPDMILGTYSAYHTFDNVKKILIPSSAMAQYSIANGWQEFTGIFEAY